MFQKRQIFFTESVTPESCAELINQLMYLENESDEKITIYINSPGGEVSSGLAVYDLISIMRAPVKTVCIGTAASMGSILFLAGNTREMLPHSKIMIHDPSYSGGDYAGIKPDEIQEKVNCLMETRKTLCEIIAERSEMSLKEVYEKTKKDTYLNAEEAVKLGIATGIMKKLIIDERNDINE